MNYQTEPVEPIYTELWMTMPGTRGTQVPEVPRLEWKDLPEPCLSG
jgi:hypothetical protein